MISQEREPKLAILVLGCLLTDYARCITVLRATWGSKSFDDVDVYYLYGGQPSTTRTDVVDIETLIGGQRPELADGEVWATGDVILCGAADLIYDQKNCILRKRLLAFRHLAAQNYDFIYNVCATSYVDVDRLRRYVRGLPSLGVYQGAVQVHGPSGYPYISGASFLISRDIAADLGAHATAIVSTYPENLPDDVVIGHVIASRHCRESVTDISSRIGAGEKPTNDQTFVMPFGSGTSDFVMAPQFAQMPQENSFHYHFNARRMWEMENFHRRFFTA